MAIRSGVTVTKDHAATVLSAVRNLAGREVLIGIPSENIGRKDGSGNYVGAANNAVLGYVHEHGSPARNIPPRPFLIPGVESIRGAATDRLSSAIKNAMSGNPQGMSEQLHAVGLMGQSAVRARITSGDFEPLSPATLAARRRRGVTREKPLIDTGQLRASIKYVIRERK